MKDREVILSELSQSFPGAEDVDTCAGYFGYPFQNQEGDSHAWNLIAT
jgi:hypothetical protein